MPKAFITGMSGQDGAYLAEFLLAKNYNVVGTVHSLSSCSHLAHLEGRIQIEEVDLADQKTLAQMIEAEQVDEFYHLAAPSFVQASWGAPVETGRDGGLAVVGVLEAIRNTSPKTRFYQASTSELFGNAETFPQSEQTQFSPRNPYSAAKLYAYWMTSIYRSRYGLHASNGILFNHESPRRGHQFVTRKITSHVAKIKRGLETELRLGDLSAKRDWGFAGDYVEVMWLMLQQSRSDDYVVATGELHSVQEFVELAFARADLDYRKYVKVDEQLVRPQESVPLVGDASKARTQLGWKPKVDFKSLVEMMVDADLKRVERDHRA